MKKVFNAEFLELFCMTLVFAIATVVAVFIRHPRVPLMIGLTVFCALITFISRFRRNRRIRTIQGKGYRRSSREKG